MIDINKFTDPENMRDLCKKPFVLGDKVVATDSSALVCIPRNNAEYEKCSNYFESMLYHIINTIQSASNWKPFKRDEIDLPEKIECLCCYGTGKAIRTVCPECNGEGEAEAKNEYSTYRNLECASCFGTGWRKDLSTDQICPDCNGEGERFREFETVQISGIDIQVKFSIDHG